MFLARYPLERTLICSFGPDWEKFTSDAERSLSADPLGQFFKMDLRLELSSIFDTPYREVTREVMVERLNLVHALRRHNALSDTYQLIEIIKGLKYAHTEV